MSDHKHVDAPGGIASPGGDTSNSQSVKPEMIGVPCPYCGDAKAFRSHRKGLIENLRSSWTGKFPFRCLACGARFFMWIDPRDR